MFNAIWDFFSCHKEKHVFYNYKHKHRIVLYIKRKKWEKDDDIYNKICNKLDKDWYILEDYCTP